MTGSTENNRRFLYDMGWYLLGTLVPMGMGFIKTPIFTRYFTPEEYGYLGIVTITFSYISIFAYSWISSCLWRYYNAFKNRDDLRGLYSNLLFIFVGTTFLMLVVAAIWYQLANSVLVKRLIVLSFLQVMIREFISLFLIVVRLEGKALKYNIIHSTRTILSFAVLYGMTFGLHYRITSVLTSTILVDLSMILIVLLFNREGVRISVKSISAETLKVLFRYGSIGLVSNFFFLLITSSDRYIIALFNDMSVVGIYNQAYNISQLSVAALVTVFFNTINPRMIRELEAGTEGADKMISNYMFAYFLFGLPVIAWLSMFPEQIAHILLGPDFRSGYIIMPWIFISAFLQGLFLFVENKFKFADKLKQIIIGISVATALNVVLNFITIPAYGYHWAAITTLAAYVFMILYFYIQDGVGFFSTRTYLVRTAKLVVLLLVQLIADRWIRQYYDLNLWQTIVEGILFLLVYLAVNLRTIKGIRIQV